MKNYKTLAVALLALGTLCACSEKASIKGTITDAAEKDVIVKQLDVNRYTILDTIKTDTKGEFSYNLKVKKGQPEFVYLFYNDTRIAALLLEKREKVTVEADTLGNYSSTGSEGSEKLAVVDKAYTKFMNDLFASRESGPALAKIYLEHYRECVKHVLSNPYSLTVIPVLYEQMSGASPVFAQTTDAIFFRNAADSLLTVYPDSRYVKALDSEANRRMKLLELENQLKSATEASFPDINLPDITGQRKALSSVDAKVILVHFWDASDAAQSMMNIETLLPVYEDYHDKGFEIYSVCVYADKATWGSIVSSQKLPWINVNDGLGTASGAITSYNVESPPASILIVNGELLNGTDIKGEAGLRKVLDKYLRR